MYFIELENNQIQKQAFGQIAKQFGCRMFLHLLFFI